MRTLLKKLLFFALVIATCNGAAYCQSMASLTLNVPDQVAKFGSEIKVEIALKNTSDHDLWAYRNPGSGPGGLDDYRSIQVADGSGNVVEEKKLRAKESQGGNGRFRIRVNGGSRAIVSLHPGEQLDGEIILSDRYDLKPGIYTIQATWIGEDKVVVKSNMITVKVTP